MKQFRIILLASFLYLLTALFPHPASATLQYFGYYNVNGLPADSRDHIPEIGARGFSNIGVITVSYFDKIPQYLEEMRQHKMYAILGVTAKFESPENERIANWRNLKEAIKGYEDIVYGFYFDESAWRGIATSDFRAWTKQIRDDYPEKAVILVEGYPPIVWETMPPGYLDYVTDFGFDFYGTVEDKDFENGWSRYLQIYQKFYPLTTGKKVWLVPDGYGKPDSPTSNLAKILQRYYEFAITRPEVVGMLVFIYDFSGSGYYSVGDTMNPSSTYYDPGVIYTHNSVGRAILANAPAYPTTSPINNPSTKPGDLDHNNKVDFADFEMLIKKFGNPYTIADFNVIVSNYGK